MTCWHLWMIHMALHCPPCLSTSSQSLERSWILEFSSMGMEDRRQPGTANTYLLRANHAWPTWDPSRIKWLSIRSSLRFLTTPTAFVSWQSVGWTNKLLKPCIPVSFQAINSNQCLQPPVYSWYQEENSLGHIGASSFQYLHQPPAMKENIIEELLDNKRWDGGVDMPSGRASV